MILPAWWPRASCVYCGARLYSDETWRRPRRHLLACPRHRSIAAVDNSVDSVDNRAPGGFSGVKVVRSPHA